MLNHMLRAAAHETTVTYITQVSDLTNAATYTFNAVSIGGPGLIVVCLHAGQGTTTAYTVTSCTIGGVAATIHTNPSSPDSCAIASAVVTAAGAFANISFTVSTTVLRAVVGVFRVQNYMSATPVAVASTTTGTGGTRSVTLNTSSNGVVVAGTTHSDASTFTWTNVVEAYDVTLAESSNSFSGARNATSGGSRTVTVVSTGTAPANGYVLSAVSWR